MSNDFFDENNLCGQALVNLVSRGNAIISEILRLADYIPDVFRLQNKNDQNKYGNIITDFIYLKTQDAFENKINQSIQLQDLDEQFRENHIDILTRFFLTFESIHKYSLDLKQFLNDLENGLYIQQTLETLIEIEDAKQLLVEGLYLCGVILLVVDMKIEGTLRERLLVSYLRYSGTAKQVGSDSNVDDVFNLMRSTGMKYEQGTKRPDGYPEKYFSRVTMDHRDDSGRQWTKYISIVNQRLVSDDVYNQVSAFPHHLHHTTALSIQASMLYVTLYFQPDILKTQQARMRQIVDKYFPDNWVVSLYMGITVNLIEVWEPYKSAKQALHNSLSTSNCKELAVRHLNEMKTCMRNCSHYLKEGVLTDEFMLKDSKNLEKCLRECNVTLRWLMLHTINTDSGIIKKCRQTRELIIKECGGLKISENIFNLLIVTAELECKLKEMFKRLLDEKEENWTVCKQECAELLKEIADVFSGKTPLTRVQKDEGYKKWFEDMSERVSKLNYVNPTESGRNITSIIDALKHIKSYDKISSSLQLVEWISIIINGLWKMLRTVNIREESLIKIEVVSDFSYAWKIMDEHYTAFMQEGVKKHPQMVIKLRSTFLKLASSMDLPLLRINQAGSNDLVSVSQYYSNELVNYFRKVLQIIPKSMFGLLAQIAKIQTEQIGELPTRLEKDKMKEYAKLDARYNVAKLTHQISVFTEGMLKMKTTFVGVIKIDPNQLLEDGIRKELVNRISAALHGILTFNPRSRVSELKSKLADLVKAMGGFKRSFEYIQDYVNIYGLKIWQEEMMRIINFNVERECNSFLRQKVLEFESIYQSREIPIPKFQPTDQFSVTFMGRLAREFLRITNVKSTIYMHATEAWYDGKTKQEIIDISLLNRILSSLGTHGMSGLDRLYRFMVVKELLKYTQQARTQVDKSWKETLNNLYTNLIPTHKLIEAPAKVYLPVVKRFNDVLQNMNETIASIGHMQLISTKICQQLNFHCQFHSKSISTALGIMNKSLLTAIEKHYEDPANNKYPSDDNPLMYELTNYIDMCGMDDPLAKIYITTRHLDISLLVFLSTIVHLQKVSYNKLVDGLILKKQGDGVDSHPFLIGVITLLRQFHVEETNRYLQLLCQLINSYLGPAFQWNSKTNELPSEVINGCFFLEKFLLLSKTERKVVEKFMPCFTMAEFRKVI